jgi:hypothetical protein
LYLGFRVAVNKLCQHPPTNAIWKRCSKVHTGAPSYTRGIKSNSSPVAQPQPNTSIPSQTLSKSPSPPTKAMRNCMCKCVGFFHITANAGRGKTPKRLIHGKMNRHAGDSTNPKILLLHTGPGRLKTPISIQLGTLNWLRPWLTGAQSVKDSSGNKCDTTCRIAQPDWKTGEG